MRAAVVTPTYNERENLEALVTGLRRARPGIGVIVVDDGSPDGTGALAHQLAADLGDLWVVERAGKQGLASAYVAGFQRALALGFDHVVQMDADLSHDPADVPRLLAEGADLVLGSRYVEGGGTRFWPRHRQLLSRFGSTYARVCLGLPYRDLTGGFKCWSAPLLRQVLSTPVRSDGYVFQVEMTQRAHRLGASVREIPIVFTERRHGASKMSLNIAVEAALRVPGLRSP